MKLDFLTQRFYMRKAEYTFARGSLYLRKGLLTFDQALEIQNEAEALLQNSEFIVTSLDVLQLVQNSECSAYDCEFVALAQSMNAQLITMDKKILKNFPETAKPLL